MEAKKEDGVVILHADGTKERYVGEMSLKEFYRLLDCDLVVYCETRGGNVLIIDEEGKFKGLAQNAVATSLYYPEYDFIVGDAIYVPRNVFREWQNCYDEYREKS